MRTRYQIEAENAQLKAQVGHLDRVLRTIEGLGSHSGEILLNLVAQFEGDPAQEKVAQAVADLADRWSTACADMAAALRASQH